VLLALIAGVAIGTLAALRQNTTTDYAAMGAAMTGIMVPNFVLAPLLTLVFGLWLSWLPVGGWDGSVKYMILPVFALSLYQVGFIARLTRGSMIEVLRTNYVRTARAKGLPERVAITRHALKAGMLPVVSYLGPRSSTPSPARSSSSRSSAFRGSGGISSRRPSTATTRW
jgi:ABC-type dipeptide/oligopeptide/nickel transport systems, permease components